MTLTELSRVITEVIDRNPTAAHCEVLALDLGRPGDVLTLRGYLRRVDDAGQADPDGRFIVIDTLREEL